MIQKIKNIRKVCAIFIGAGLVIMYFNFKLGLLLHLCGILAYFMASTIYRAYDPNPQKHYFDSVGKKSEPIKKEVPPKRPIQKVDVFFIPDHNTYAYVLENGTVVIKLTSGRYCNFFTRSEWQLFLMDNACSEEQRHIANGLFDEMELRVNAVNNNI